MTRCYQSLRRIGTDNLQALAITKEVHVFIGPTGTGKSHAAWQLAGYDAYPKDPRTKFWDGYNGQKNVVIDEFRGGIDIAHMLRWLDKYPVIIEVKGSSRALSVEKIFITSNLEPHLWYPDCDLATIQALERRLNVTVMDQVYVTPTPPTQQMQDDALCEYDFE